MMGGIGGCAPKVRFASDERIAAAAIMYGGMPNAMATELCAIGRTGQSRDMPVMRRHSASNSS
jgi:hypothetical protein